ncbi:Abi family protein [Oceanivirga salmonicida]|uniref:Abi family protein n=1 Tax=Oceanivirga salmonicida TaxID=1769291 RepID=UPI000835909F|nr:Abi family protein [Oceanivirga salmonicida]
MKTKENEFKTFKEQVQLFKKRGMIIKDEDKAEETLKFINYYKIKECSLPFLKDNKYNSEITFEEILIRFYENKNLRIDLLRLTEKVELSLKTKVSYILGQNLGAYGYLKFSNWIDKNEYCKHYVRHKEKEFKIRATKNLYRSKNQLINQYNKLEDIPVWLLMDILTFGEILDLYKLMNEKYKKKIAGEHNLKVIEYLSWLENINLMRNLSAHNSSIVDIKFKSKPKSLPEFKNKLYFVTDKKTKELKPTNRIAISIILLEYLIFSINPNYKGGAIKKRLKKLCRNKTDIDAQKLGFRNFEVVENLKI